MDNIDIERNEKISSTVLCIPPEYKLINLKQKHKDKLLMTIYNQEGISHSELAEEIGVSPSGLNAIVKKICEDCDQQVVPLEYTKVNKYKYYRLTDSGRQYVEINLISVAGKEYEDRIYQCWELLQLRIKMEFNRNLVYLLDRYMKLDENVEEDQDLNLIYAFMDCFVEFYYKMPQNAMETLGRLTKSEEVKDKIKIIFFDRCEEKKSMEPLVDMMSENPEEAYQFADSILKHIIDWDNEGIWKLNQQYGQEILKPIVQKIEADMLRAVINFKDEQYLKKLWLSNGMDIHLAYYLAEKFKFLVLKYEQEKERKEKNEDRNVKI